MDFKTLLLILTFLIALPMVYSTNIMTIVNLNCSSDGSGVFYMSYVGSTIQAPDIKVQEKFQGEEVFGDLAGNWYQDGKMILFLEPNFNLQSPSSIQFSTNPSSLTKRGKYVVTFSYPRTSVAGDRSTAQIAVDCPGLNCSSNVQCRDDERCINTTCISLNCNVCQVGLANRCVPKCDNGDPCAVNLCNEGVCNHDKIPGCCRTDDDCYDGRACVTHTCIKNRCIRDPVVCSASTDPCTKGVCTEPVGCVYKANPLCVANSTQRTYVLNVGEPEITASSQSFLGRLFAYLASLFK